MLFVRRVQPDLSASHGDGMYKIYPIIRNIFTLYGQIIPLPFFIYRKKTEMKLLGGFR